jgi:hypothetical protein
MSFLTDLFSLTLAEQALARPSTSKSFFPIFSRHMQQEFGILLRSRGGAKYISPIFLIKMLCLFVKQAMNIQIEVVEYALNSIVKKVRICTAKVVACTGRNLPCVARN